MSASAFDIVLDELTLARARRGDLRACEAIYRLYQGPAYSIAFRICQCPSLAQDVLQEAFINAFKRLKQFRGDAPFWGWLRRVVVNHAISTLRKQPALATVELEDYHATTEGDQVRVELTADLAAAFGQLEAQDRSVVWLHDVEGYNHSEIAELFGMTESFSKTRLSRARARLRELLGQHMHPGRSPDEGSGDDVGGSLAADTFDDVASKARSYLAGGSVAADTDVSVASKARIVQGGTGAVEGTTAGMQEVEQRRSSLPRSPGADSHSNLRSYSKAATHTEFTPAFGEP
jgi:RNA polymerase sigma factor (sigma-70 family)